MEPYYWIHKVLEKAIAEASKDAVQRKVWGETNKLDLSALEAFKGE